jgi:hypothetical protein
MSQERKKRKSCIPGSGGRQELDGAGVRRRGEMWRRVGLDCSPTAPAL